MRARLRTAVLLAISFVFTTGLAGCNLSVEDPPTDSPFGSVPTPTSNGWRRITYTRSWGVPVRSIVVDCNNSDHIYIGTDTGILESSDAGNTWVNSLSQGDLPLSPQELNVRAIATTSEGPETTFLGTDSGLLIRTSVDNKWERVQLRSELPITLSIQSITLDPVNPLVVYVGTWDSGIYRSVNGGSSWESLSDSLIPPNVKSVVIDPSQSDTLYAGTFYAGIFKSVDEGNSWVPASNGLPSGTSYQLATDPKEPNVLYTSIARLENEEWIGLGIYKSTNGGISWYPSSSGLPASDVIGPVVPEPSLSGTLYTGSYDGVYKSMDSGRSWFQISEGLPRQAWVSALGIDPSSTNTLYAGTGSGELFVSSDSGQSWTGLYSGLPEDVHINAIVTKAEVRQTIYLATSRGIVRSTDGGSTWISSNNGITNTNISSIEIQSGFPSIVYAGTLEGQIYRSRDFGQNWALVWSSQIRESVNSIFASHRESETVYASTESGILLRSSDRGDSWQETYSSSASVLDFAEDARTGTLYLATWGNGVLRSVDRGENWSRVSNGLESPFASVVASDPYRPETIYTYVDHGGLFKTTDGGENWVPIGSEESSTIDHIRTLTFDPVLTDTLYAGTTQELYTSSDGGNTWILVTEGLTEETRVASIALDFSAPGNVYVATSTQGLFNGDVASISRRMQPLDLSKLAQELLDILERPVGTLSVILSFLLLVVFLNRSLIVDFALYWFAVLFRFNQLLVRIRDNEVSLDNIFLAYTLVTSISLFLLYSAAFGPLSNSTIAQISRIPHLRMQIAVTGITNLFNNLGVGFLVAGLPDTAIYTLVSIFQFLGPVVIVSLIGLGVDLVQKNTPSKSHCFNRTFTAVLAVFTYTNLTSLLLFIALAYYSALENDIIGPIATVLWSLGVLFLGILATKKVNELSCSRAIAAWMIAPVSLLISVVSRAWKWIVQLPWKSAIESVLAMIFHPLHTIRRLRNEPFSTMSDTRSYSLAYILSFTPFLLLVVCLKLFGISIPKPITELFLGNVLLIWFTLLVIVSLIELIAQWLNQKTHPISRREPSKIYQWGTLFRVLFVANVAVDVGIRIVFSVFLVGLIITFESSPGVGVILAEGLKQISVFWKVVLGAAVIIAVYDDVRWRRIWTWLGRGPRYLFSKSEVHKLGRLLGNVLLRPKSIAMYAKKEKALEKSLLLFAGSILTRTFLGFIGRLLYVVYESRTFILSEILYWKGLLEQGSLFLLLLVLSALIYLYYTSRKARELQRGNLSLNSNVSYAHIVVCLLLSTSSIHIVFGIFKLALSFPYGGAIADIVILVEIVWQAVWFGVSFHELTDLSWPDVQNLFFSVGVAGILLAFWLFGNVLLGALIVLSALFTSSLRASIPPNPLRYVVQREDLRTIRQRADVYFLLVQRTRRARKLYLKILELSKVLPDPNSRLGGILRTWEEMSDLEGLATPLLPEGAQLLRISRDITSTLVHLLSIDAESSFSYIADCLAVDGETSSNWERIEECREAALEALVQIIRENPEQVFESIALLINHGVQATALQQVAKKLPKGILTDICSVYNGLLAYDEMRNTVTDKGHRLQGSMELGLYTYIAQTVKRAASVFAECRSFAHGGEVSLIYDLLSRSIEAKFFRDVVVVNFDYSQLTLIDDPLFPDTVSSLGKLGEVTNLLVRSEKVDLSQRLQYYAQMVDYLDRLHNSTGGGSLLDIEHDAIVQVIVPRWKTLLLNRIKELRGGASLSIALARAGVIRHRGDLVVTVRNDGKGIAENVRVSANAQESSIELSPPDQLVDTIMPNTEVNLAFEAKLTPKTAKRRAAFDIVYDDLEGNNKSIVFATDIASRYQKKAFHKLEPIPYITGRPLKAKDMFYGRSDIIRDVLESIPAKSQDNIVLIQGERRTGKTSLLYQLQQKLGPRYAPVYVDLQGMLDPGEAAFLHGIAVRIQTQLEEKQISLSYPQLSAFLEGPGAHFRDVFLRQVTDRLGNRRLVLMIDEFEVLEDRVREGKLHQEIFDYLRHLMQHCDIDFVFTGTYRIVEIAKRYWSVLFNAALSKELELLTRLETYSLAREPVAGYFEYDDYALRKIWQVTAGHPFFVQLLCRELISYGNKNQISYFTVQDVNDIIDDLLQVGDIHLGYIWNELTNTKEARILLAVLSELVHTREIAVLTEIQATLDRYEVSLDLDEILRELKARGIIKEHEGRYSFKIGLVGKWIYETRSIESLV